MSSIEPADVAGAVARYLKDAVGDQVGGRVFRPELKTGESESMPRAAIVVRPNGGYVLFSDSNAPIGDPTLDVFCYGDEWHAANLLAASVVIALQALRTSTWGNCRLMWARISAGPLPYEDANTHWPCAVVSAQVAHCELAVA